MALALFDRVQETTTTTGTGSLTLAGAVSGFQSFAVVGDTNTCYYTIVDGSEWEVGIGTYSTTGPALARTTILSNSLGNTSPITLTSGSKQVFLTYPAEKSVNLDASGNVSPLGTVSSGIWQGATVGVAYGGTGVTASSGANSVMLRDTNQNVSVNRLNQADTQTTAAGGITVLTAASTYSQSLKNTGSQTYKMPDATTLATGVAFIFNNNATGVLTLQDYAAGAIGTITSGGAAELVLLDNTTVAGTWDVHGFLPEAVTWGTNALELGTTVITGGTWNGGTVTSAYGGTGLTTFAGANNALYSTSSSALTAGTLPVVAGGTGQTSFTDGQLLIGNTTGNTLAKATLTAGTGISITNGAGAVTITNTASVACATPTAAGIVYGQTKNTSAGSATALGYQAGQTSQGNCAIAIGKNAGQLNQPEGSIAIGVCATTIQGCPLGLAQSVAIGTSSFAKCSGVSVGANAKTPPYSVAIGQCAGAFSTCGSVNSVAIGYGTSPYNSPYSVTIGNFAGTNCAGYGIAIGYGAFANSPTSVVINGSGSYISSSTSCSFKVAPIRYDPCASSNNGLFYNSCTKEVLQGPAGGGGGVCCATPYAVGIVYGLTCAASGRTALGYLGGTYQGCRAVAIGNYAGFSQGAHGVAIGADAGRCSQGDYAVAIGSNAGQFNSGCYSVSIGANTGSGCANNSVAIGTNTFVSFYGSCQTHIGPIRNSCGPYTLKYCPSTREITYV